MIFLFFIAPVSPGLSENAHFPTISQSINGTSFLFFVTEKPWEGGSGVNSSVHENKANSDFMVEHAQVVNQKQQSHP